MSDGYFVDTTSIGVGAGGDNFDAGADTTAHTGGGPGDGATAGGDPRDASAADDSYDSVTSGGDDIGDALPRPPDVAADALTGTRDAARDAVANVVEAGGTVVFSENFESGAVGALPGGWARVGGSAGDWGIVVDSSQVLAQSKSPSSTLRVCYASATAARAATLSARVKVTQYGSSGTTTAMLCLRYVNADGSYQCAALEPGAGVQIKTNLGDGPVWPGSVSLGAWYAVTLASDDTGLLSVLLQGALVGTFRPTATIAGGSIAVATQSAEVEFDDVLLTAP